MSLIVDIGNTRVKVANFEGNSLNGVEFFNHELWIPYVKSKSEDSLLISNVGMDDIVVKEYFPEALILTHKLKFGFENLYATPETLGVDRIALVEGSMAYGQSNRLIIDLGSCITYDFINNKNEYLGGAISPGLQIRGRSLNNFTAKLPLIDSMEINDLIGRSTSDAIRSGVFNGVIHELNGVITSYEDQFGELDVIITGGDAKTFESKIKRTIFVAPNLALEGLNKILQDNS